MEPAEELLGICGLYCGTCPNYLAAREGDAAELGRISEATGIPVARVRCDGCLSENVFEPCIDCRHGFRACAAERNVTWCFECPDLPCRRLEAFRDVHVVDGISHHENVVENLRYAREHGVKRFVEDQERRGRCPRCGRRLYWHQRRCPECNEMPTEG